MNAPVNPLEAFVGAWTLTTTLDASAGGHTTFEWALDGRFLVQRAGLEHPEAPDLLAIIAPNDADDGYTQHYFDSRGVVRIYAMTLRDGVWTLLRETSDFTPLSFRQRFIGEFSPDANVIEGRWEMGTDGGGWRLDFGITYTRAD